MARDISWKGSAMTAQCEAFVIVPYPDGEHFSIAIGHNDPTLREGDTISIAAGMALFREDLKPRVAAVNRWLGEFSVSQEWFDVLVDLYFNAGTKPTRMVIADLKDGFPLLASNRLLTFIKAKDKHGVMKESAGLEKRRERCRTIVRTGDYGDLGKIKVYHGDPWSKTTRTEWMDFPREEGGQDALV